MEVSDVLQMEALYMEALYAKLYDKYTKLKVNRFSKMDELIKDQEEKFVKCTSAADELINLLTKENEELETQNNQLRSKVSSISSSWDEHSAEYQKLLMEVNQKNKTLSEELERLRNLQQEGFCGGSKDNRNKNIQLNTPEGAQVSVDVSNGEARKTTTKPGRDSRVEAESILTPPSTGQVRESGKDLSKITMSSGELITIQQPECSSRNIDISGGGGNDNGLANCMFEFVIECLLGMKISTVNQNERISILALHESSGYSINLTTVKTGAGKEAELLCQVISLGTLGRVAPECMREDIIISKQMCPVFFERVSRVIKFA